MTHLIHSSRARCGHEGQGGSVIVLVAVCLVVLLMFAALAIDVQTIAAAKQQALVRTEMASLAAAEQFFGSTAATPEAALLEAVNRANQVAQLNESVAYITNSAGVIAEYGLGYQGGCDTGSGYDCTRGTITPGQYYLEDPDGAGVLDPCLGAYPCFVEAINAGDDISAFRVETDLSTTPFRTWMGGITGWDNVQTVTRATTALIPRRAIGVLDLSRSMISDTHLSNNLECDDPSACYTYFDSFVSPPNPTYLHDFYAAPDFRVSGLRSLFPYEPGGDACTVPGNPDIGLEDQCFYDALENVRPGSAIGTPWVDEPTVANFSQTKWYKNDYPSGSANTRGFTETVNDTCLRGGASPVGNRTFEFPEPDPTREPQPLFTSLRVVKAVYDEFLNLVVAGDRIGFIGHDDCVPTSAAENRFFDLETPTAATAEQIDPDNANRYYIDNMLFPVSNPGGSSRPNTDGVTAMRQALTILADQPNSNLASNFVMLFTDGLFNCDSPGPPTAPDCLNTFDRHETAMTQLDLLADDLATQRIAVHVFFAGELVDPHTLLYPSFELNNGCMSDGEARYLGVNYVDDTCGGGACGIGDWTDLLQGIDTFSGHIDNFYGLARTTGGEFVPLVDCCRNAAGNCDATIEDTLDAACDPQSGWAYTNPPNPPLIDVSPWAVGGKLRCNPDGTSAEQRGIAAAQRIMGQNPYRIVPTD